MLMYDKQNLHTKKRERKEIVALSGSLEVSVSPKAYDTYQETRKMLFKQQKNGTLFVYI